MNGFEFTMPGKIVFGTGKLAEAGTLTKQFGNKTMIVCDKFTVKNGLAGRLQDILTSSGINVVIYDSVIPNPTVELIDNGATIAKKKKIDFVIGLGGGSSMDAAKGIAVAAAHSGSIWPYAIGEKPITAKILPIVAITTTSGTGSQCTCFAVISNPATNQKPGMGGVLPSLAIIDPELPATMPPELTLATGFDVFSHAVEAYTSSLASPFSDMYAEKALTLVGKYLPLAYKDGANMEARTGMALADTCAGIAISHAAVTAAHVIAHVIGGHHHDIAHGDALASIYREIMVFNAGSMPEKEAFVADSLVSGCSDSVTAYDSFFGQFCFENRLKLKYQADKELAKRLAKDTFTYMKVYTELNPVKIGVADVEKILKKSLQ
jgi:alcohol dehydrogenase class IV